MCWTEDRDVAVFDMEGTRRDLAQHRRYRTETLGRVTHDESVLNYPHF